MTHPNSKKADFKKNVKKAGDVVGKRPESIATAYHRLVTNKLRATLACETLSLRPDFDNRYVDRHDRFRIPCSKTT